MASLETSSSDSDEFDEDLLLPPPPPWEPPADAFATVSPRTPPSSSGPSSEDGSGEDEEDDFLLPPPSSMPPPPPVGAPTSSPSPVSADAAAPSLSASADIPLRTRSPRMVELAPARTMVATAAAAAPGQSDSNFAAPSSGLTISVNNTGAIEATTAHPTRGLNKVGVTRQRRRRRSSVMDLVNAFRRGSLEQNKEKEKELAEQREQRANELLSIHPSVKRPATPDAVTKNLNKDAEDESGGKGWNRARRASFAPEVAADEAWQKLTDPASGRSYWWNPTTQESRWTDPHGMANVVASVAAVAAAARPSQSSLQHDLSQEGDEWVTMKDPSSGQEFYFNRRKNESQWTKPAAMNKNSSTTHSNGEGGSGSSTNSPPAVSSSSSKGDASSASIIAELRAQLLTERNAHAASRAEFRDALDAEREHMKNEMMLAREDNERYLNAIGEESRLQAERESAQIAKLTALMETMVENEQRHEDVLLEKEEQVAALREQIVLLREKDNVQHTESQEAERASLIKQLDKLRLENGDLKTTLTAITSAKELAEKRYNTSEEQRVAALASVAALTPKPPTEEEKMLRRVQDQVKQANLDAARREEIENAAEMERLLDCVNFIATALTPLLDGVCNSADKLRDLLADAAPRAAEAASEKTFLMSGASENQAFSIDATLLSSSPNSIVVPSSDAKRNDLGDVRRNEPRTSLLGLSPSNGVSDDTRAAAAAAAAAGSGPGVLMDGTGFSMLKTILAERLGEQEHRHRIEVQELEKMSHRALESMAKGWADCRGQLERSVETCALLNEECRDARAQAEKAAEEVMKIAKDYHRHVRQINRSGGGVSSASMRDPWRGGKAVSATLRASPSRAIRGRDAELVDARLVAVDRVLNGNNRGSGEGRGIGFDIHGGAVLSSDTKAPNAGTLQEVQSPTDQGTKGPQVELFIWRAAMKHAEDLREERAARHRETTTMRGALALEASTFITSARFAVELSERLRGVQRALHEQLWQKPGGDDADSVVTEVDSVVSGNFSGRDVGAAPDPGKLPMKSLLPVTMHDIDQRAKVGGDERKKGVTVLLPRAPPGPPGPSPKKRNGPSLAVAKPQKKQEVIMHVGPPASSPPAINPLLAMMAMASPPMSPPPAL